MRSPVEMYLLAGGVLVSVSTAALPPLDEIVMYEVNTRAMSAEGDFAGIADRLDEIEALGVNTIWLMPVHPVGEINRFGPLGSPYSVRDHLAVGREYGTMDDLHALIEASHERGISIILDWVGNHTAWDHPWIDAHPDWYTQDADGNIIHPAGTNWYDVADLNYDVPTMREAMIAQMVWWVQHTGIDGFRMDAADFLPYDFWEEAVMSLRASTERPLLLLAEGARADHHAAGFDLRFGWRFFTGLDQAFIQGQAPSQIGLGHADEYAPVPEGRSVLRWTTNHDETAYHAPPPLLFGGVEPSKAAYGAMIVYGGTPLIYSGQEVGSTDLTQIVDIDPIDWENDPQLEDWYRWIISVRQQHESLRVGAYTDRSDQDTLIVARTLDEERVAAWINTRPYPVSAPISASWASTWTDLSSGVTGHLQGTRPLAPHEIRIARLESWPGLVAAGALQTEQGDVVDWDPEGSSLLFDSVGAVYQLEAHNLVPSEQYGLEILTDRGLPPVDSDDPRIAYGLIAVGDADGTVTVRVCLNRTNNKGQPVVWIDTDAAPLQVVGNFMDEAGGAADWDPADPMFAMEQEGGGRYTYHARISTPGSYAFKTSFGAGWGHQVGTDGYNDNAHVLEFRTDEPYQLVRLIVDLRAQQLDAWVNPCRADLNADGVLDFFDVSLFLGAYLEGSPIADFTLDTSLDFFDVSAFLTMFGAGC